MSDNSEADAATTAAQDNNNKLVLETLEKRLRKMEEMYAAHEETILELKTENLLLRDRLASLDSRPVSSMSVSKSQSTLSSPRKSAPPSPRKSPRKGIK